MRYLSLLWLLLSGSSAYSVDWTSLKACLNNLPKVAGAVGDHVKDAAGRVTDVAKQKGGAEAGAAIGKAVVAVAPDFVMSGGKVTPEITSKVVEHVTGAAGTGIKVVVAAVSTAVVDEFTKLPDVLAKVARELAEASGPLVVPAEISTSLDTLKWAGARVIACAQGPAEALASRIDRVGSAYYDGVQRLPDAERAQLAGQRPAIQAHVAQLILESHQAAGKPIVDFAGFQAVNATAEAVTKALLDTTMTTPATPDDKTRFLTAFRDGLTAPIGNIPQPPATKTAGTTEVAADTPSTIDSLKQGVQTLLSGWGQSTFNTKR